MEYELTEIETDNYLITHDIANATVRFEGGLRLEKMQEYEPIVQMLERLIAPEPLSIMLDIRRLSFLNSSGINVLSKFIMKVARKGTIKLVVQLSTQHPWQDKVLRSLQRMMPTMQLEYE